MIPIHGMPSAPAPRLRRPGARATTGLAVLHAAKIDDVATARHAIREGQVDLVGMTRAHLADPHIVRKIVEGREAEIRPVRRRDLLPRPHLRGRRGAVHPQRGDQPRGDDAARHPTGAATAPGRGRRRRAGGAGGGTGGRRARPRRDVLEAMPWAGGQIRLAARNPRRRDLLGIVEWRVAELARLGVDVRYDTLRRGRRRRSRSSPTSSIVATGGLPQLPELEDGRRPGRDELGRARRRRHAAPATCCSSTTTAPTRRCRRPR